jgi:amicyanin
LTKASTDQSAECPAVTPRHINDRDGTAPTLVKGHLLPASAMPRPTSPRTAKAVLGASAVLLLATACGAGSDSGGAITMPPGASTPPMTTMPTMPTMPGMSATGGGSVASKVPVVANHVNIKDFKFQPAILRVKAGVAVTWTNLDEEPHTVVGGPLRSAVLAGGQASYSFTFSKPGTYSYQCSIHPFMHGTVVVT